MHREQISELSRSVSDLLTEYIQVRDGVFAIRWWRSIPIPGLFRPIPFDKFAIQISQVEHGLGEIERQLRDLYKKGTPDEQTYLDILHQYITALSMAVVALSKIVVGQKGKNEGKQYGLSTYNADCAAYKEAQNHYYVLGAEMNRRWRAYKSGSN